MHRAVDGGSGGGKRGTPSSGHAEGEGGREAVHRASFTTTGEETQLSWGKSLFACSSAAPKVRGASPQVLNKIKERTNGSAHLFLVCGASAG